MPRSPLKSSALGLAAAAALAWLPDASCAAKPPATLVAENPGANPFIKIVQWHMDDPALLDHVQFTVTPKPGSVTRPLSARYSKAYLVRRGFLDAKTGLITTPVFGLYADYTNRVEVAFTFVDGTAQDSHLSLPTPQYNGGRYDHPDVIEPRTRDTTLSYDFIMLKSFNNGDAPKIIDTDGELRWVGTAHTTSQPVIFFHNSFFVRGVVGSVLVRMEFDGAYTEVANYASQGITTFFHNFDFGKTGILTDVDTLQYVESEVMEVAPGGQVLHIWNFADIISAAIRQGGDDPARFVAAAGSDVDWFHANCAAYRPSDDSLIVSSRENFVMAVDYETGAIKWIFGDPTKAWYQFPSLRKYALKAEPGTPYPIGQHGLSFYRDKLLLFDDGAASVSHVPAGKNRTFSAPRKYAIDDAAGTAREVWKYLADPPIYSPIGSSVYEDGPGNYLVDYAAGGPNLYAEILGLNAAGDKVFDYRYAEGLGLSTAWNAVVLHLEDLDFR